MRRTLLPLLFAVAACATDVPEGRFRCTTAAECPTGWVCRTDGRCWSTGDGNLPDGGAGCTPGSCPGDQLCRDGRCISPMDDGDEDGVPAGSDCDDADPAVGMHAERGCSSDCAVGRELCVMGTWEACDAPTDCDCSAGETRELPCGNCGTQRQRCGDAGAWEDDGACSGEGECSPGASEDTGACGMCGTMRRTCLATCVWDEPVCRSEGECGAGAEETEASSCGTCGEERHRTRACTAACAWGDWGDWGTCTESPGCEPAAVESEDVPCGACESGSRSRTRTCDTACSWGAWGAWGSCTGESGCAPATTSTENACTTAGNCTRVRTCTASCAWGDWGSWGSCTGCGAGTADFDIMCCGATCDYSKERTRTCSETCAWGAWGAWESCS